MLFNLPEAPNPSKWTTIIKPFDEDMLSNATLKEDKHLRFFVKENTRYLFRGTVFFFSDGSRDFKYDMTSPPGGSFAGASGSFVMYNALHCPGGSGPVFYFTDSGTFAGALTNTSIVLDLTGFFRCIIQFTALLQVGPSGGEVVFRWAQNASGASDTIVLAGSFFEYCPIISENFTFNV